MKDKADRRVSFKQTLFLTLLLGPRWPCPPNICLTPAKNLSDRPHRDHFQSYGSPYWACGGLHGAKEYTVEQEKVQVDLFIS